ncbi:MAG: hypothetical protein JW760_07975, partial [Spirochaetales bacterium]|nr:hypothetical protein [Spirochaetales bacterium]
DNKLLRRRTLVVVGAIAGIIAVFLFRRNLGAEYYMLHTFGLFPAGPAAAPVTAELWFELFSSRPFIGLVLSNFFDAVNGVLVFLLMLALYLVIKNTGKTLAAVFISVSALSALIYSFTSVSFPLLVLSGHYGSGISPEEQQCLLEAAAAILSKNNPALPVSGFGPLMAVFLLFVSGLLASILMLRTGIWKRWVGIVGLVAHISGLLFFPVVWFASALCFLPMTLSAPFIVVWYAAISVKLLGMVKGEKFE